MGNKNSGSDNELPPKREIEIDLLQRRFNNKTQRSIRAIQFNLVALTAVVGIIQFGAPTEFEIDGLFLFGGGLLALSGVCSFIGVALNGAPLPVEANDNKEFDLAALVKEYQSRNQRLEKLVNGALVAGGVGIVILILNVIQISEVDPALPLIYTSIGVVALLLGSVAVGRYWANS